MRTVPFWNFYTFLLTFDGIGCLYSSAESTFHGKFKSIFEHAYCSEENKQTITVDTFEKCFLRVYLSNRSRCSRQERPTCNFPS